MNKRTIIFKAIISFLIVLGMYTILMPYFGVTNKDVNKAFENNFGDLYDEDEFDFEIVSSDDEDKEIYITEKENGYTLLGDVILLGDEIEADSDEDFSKVSAMRNSVIGIYIAAWSCAAIAFAMIMLLGGKLKYILSMAFSFLSSMSLISAFIILPNIAKDAFIEAIESELINDAGIWDQFFLDFLRATVLERTGGFVRDLLQSSLKVGFWLFFILTLLAFFVSLAGLVIECVKGKASKAMAKLMGLSGEYEGAELEIGNGIIIGRSPSSCQLIINSDRVSRKHCKVEYNAATEKYIVTDFSSNGTYLLGGKRLDENVPVELEKGAIIQLGRKGDTFRLG